MSIPTKGEEFTKLIEHLRLGQESAAMIAHLHRDDSKAMAMGWLAVSEGLKQMQQHVIKLATKGLQ
jgi:hypothetical protein